MGKSMSHLKNCRKVGNKHGHFLIKYSYPYTYLNVKSRHTIQKQLIGMKYSYEQTASYEHLNSLLQEYLSDVDYVYIGGR